MSNFTNYIKWYYLYLKWFNFNDGPIYDWMIKMNSLFWLVKKKNSCLTGFKESLTTDQFLIGQLKQRLVSDWSKKKVVWQFFYWLSNVNNVPSEVVKGFSAFFKTFFEFDHCLNGQIFQFVVCPRVIQNLPLFHHFFDDFFRTVGEIFVGENIILQIEMNHCVIQHCVRGQVVVVNTKTGVDLGVRGHRWGHKTNTFLPEQFKSVEMSVTVKMNLNKITILFDDVKMKNIFRRFLKNEKIISSKRL